MPSSSASSRRRASRGSSPVWTFPPGNSHAPARWVPGLRWVRRTRPSSTSTAAATSTVSMACNRAMSLYSGAASYRVNGRTAAVCRLELGFLAVSSPAKGPAMNHPAFPSEDGNFKRGAFKPIAIVIGVLLVAGAGAFAFLGVHTDAQTLNKEDVNKEIREIQLLPKAEQTPRWRKWASVENEPRLEQE